MPILKKPTKPTATSKKPAPFEIGDKVFFLEDGEEYNGEITKIKGKDAIIEASHDGELYSQPLADLKSYVEEEKPKKGKLPAPNGAKSKGKGTSLAGALKNAEVPEGGGGLPSGSWEALIIGARTEEDKEGRRVGILEFCGVGDSDVEGKTQNSRSLLLDAEGAELPGLGWFKKDLLKLEVDMDAIDSDEELDQALEELAQREPWVDITVKPQKNNPQYSNIFLDGLKEDQDNKPERPAF